MKNEIFAIIDMGTNTFHLLIARCIDNRVETLFYEKIGVRIGQGGINNNIIQEDAIERAKDCFLHFSTIIKE